MKQTVKTSRAAGQLEKMFRELNNHYFGGQTSRTNHQPEKDSLCLWSHHLFQGLAGRQRKQI